MWYIIVVVLSSVNNLKMSIPGSGLQCIVVLMLRMMNLNMPMYTEFMLCSPFFRIFGSVAEYFEIQHPLLWFAGECGV